MAELFAFQKADWPYKVDIEDAGKVPFVNITPHQLAKYPSHSVPDALEPEKPIWAVPASGILAEAFCPGQGSPSASTWCRFYGPGYIQDEVIPPTQNLSEIRFRNPELLVDEEFHRMLEALRGCAVFCSAIAASVLGDFKRFGIHCFVPTTKMSDIVRDSSGVIIGCRGICNATRYSDKN